MSSTVPPAVLRPSTLVHALRANLSVEPKVLFVYLLLLVVPWVLWQGYRTGVPEDDADASSGEAMAAPEPTEDTGSGRQDERRAKRRRRGHIEWIQ